MVKLSLVAVGGKSELVHAWLSWKQPRPKGGQKLI